MSQTFQLGNSNSTVADIKRHLLALGYSVSGDSVFDHATLNAVKSFQQDHGIPSTGKVDHATFEVIMGRKPVAPIEVTEPTYRENTGLHIVVVSSDDTAEELSRCIATVSAIMGAHREWGLTVAIADEKREPRVRSLSGSSSSIEIISYYGHAVVGYNKALKHCKDVASIWPYVYMIRACDMMCEATISSCLPLLLANNCDFAFGDWMSISGGVERASLDSIWMEQVPVGATIFSAKLISPGSLAGVWFDEALLSDAEREMCIRLFSYGTRMIPLPGHIMCTVLRRISVDTPWKDLRFEFHRKLWHKPKVSALLLTGKCPERYALARVAVQCFLDQTWANKELVIINHGQEDVWPKDPRIKEVRVEKGRFTLGDMRNWSIDHATGDWCVQWDDDDWHHPTRIQNQMEHAKDGHMISFIWQIRASLTDHSAFYDKFPTGQQMSVLFPRDTKAKYEPLEAREDTAFMASFEDRVIKIDNSLKNFKCDPAQYVRFYHGRNIWDYGHMMRGSDGQNVPVPNVRKLSPYHNDLLTMITGLYESQPGFSASHTHAGPPPP